MRLCLRPLLCLVLTASVALSAATAAAQPGPLSGQLPEDAEASGPVQRLSVDEAVRLALEQNLGIRVERMNPQIQDLVVAQARSVWTPSVFSSMTGFSQDSPPNSFLSGGQEKVSDDQFGTSVGVEQRLPWGGSYRLGWNSSRNTTTNIFSNFNPVLRSDIDFSIVQPLAQNFGIDQARQQVIAARTNRDIADVRLRETIVVTERNVKSAYWDLVYAQSFLQVQLQSLELSRESLRNNRARVEIGTMAPIDIVEAEAEVARNEEAVILAEAAISGAEDRLRALIYDPSTPGFWELRIEPTDAPRLETQPIDVGAAVRTAVDERTDLTEARRNLELNDVNIRYFRNQILPQVNLEANYGLAGLGGTQLVRGPGFPGDIIGESRRSFGSVLSDLFANEFPTWTLGVTIGYPIGTSAADANLARARMQYSQAQTQLKNLELQVATQVRDLGRQVNTNLKRIEATRAARVLAERRLEAEQKKFGVGMSTNFIIFQVQRDLAEARNNEIRAILDYNQSLVDFEAAQEAPLGTPIGTVGARRTGFDQENELTTRGQTMPTTTTSQTPTGATGTNRQRR